MLKFFYVSDAELNILIILIPGTVTKQSGAVLSLLAIDFCSKMVKETSTTLVKILQ
jgi:hypothetical protein